MSARIEALRQAPHSPDAEQAVLGGLMLDERAFGKVADWLSEEDFYRKEHRMIFRAVMELQAKGQPCDPVTLGEWFQANLDGFELDNLALKIANSTPSAANVVAYAEIVRERSRLRQLIDVGTNIATEAFKPKADASLIASTSQNALSGLVGDVRGGGLVSSRSRVGAWWSDIQRRFEAKETLTGLQTPFADLDAVTLGLQAGDVIIVAARPSMGKTVFGCELARHAAVKLQQHVAFFSLEMRHEAILQRMIAAQARVQHKHLRSPQELVDEEWSRVADATTAISAAPLYIDDQRRLTPTQIIARAKRQHLRNPIKLVVIDHLHEVRLPGKASKADELGDAARELRSLASDLNCPLVLLVQLNRGTATVANHRPQLEHLRGSGGIEEVGDVILLLHREDYYDRNTHLQKIVEVILAKGRDLPAGESIWLQNQYSMMKLENCIELPQREGKTKTNGSKPKGLSAPVPYSERAEA